jgi:DNA repair exonuclease SbcCD nuclease subunit
MKNPIFIIFNDAHLKPGNEEETLLSVRHMISYAVKNKIKTIVFAGDLFHSRSNQKESVLQAADKIFEEINLAGLYFIIFPGNHDKTTYTSYTSFLDVYRFHPNVLFTNKIMNIEIGGKSVTLLPFFDDSMLVPMLEEAEGADILISHFEMAGSSHLGQVSDKGSITKKTLRKWGKTYLGHYHNTHEITPNIIHLPSLRQQDFGEDSHKGFSVIFDDSSYEIIQGVFRLFTKVILDIDTLTTAEVKELIKTYANSSDSIRFELIGEESKLKALDKEQFKGTGIDIKLKYEKKYSSESEEDAPKLIKKFDMGQVVSTFKEFCIEKGYDHEIGLTYLNKFLSRANG